MLFKPNPSSGVPIYLQLMEQVKHAIETGALRPGDQLPGIRKVAEDLVINPNTVAKAYRELEHDGVIELRQGTGAFVVEHRRAQMLSERLGSAQSIIKRAVGQLKGMGLAEEEMRRLFEAELIKLRAALAAPPAAKKR
jgi:GntR family transcriptional regulator